MAEALTDLKGLLAAADAVAARDGATVASQLLSYRTALWGALAAGAPASAAVSWQALYRANPAVPEVDSALITALSVSPPDANRDLALVEATRRAAVGAVAHAERQQRARKVAAIRGQGFTLGLLIIVVCALAGIVAAGTRLLEPTDLAKGKPWRASSSWGACDPERGRCGALVSRIFFHTSEDESPWVEIDLGKPTSFSSVTVVNRKDDYRDRASPLLVEVGDDTQKWKEVARTDEIFSTWKPKFEPQTARFVRVRVPRKTWLHLEAVKVHP